VIEPVYRWLPPRQVAVDSACREVGAAAGVSERLLGILAARGVSDAAELRRFLGPPEDAVHDPGLLPDVPAALRRVALARERDERAMVYGDFDADGLAGLAILTIALRRVGLDAAPYAPERLGDGHGLSLRAIDRAAAEKRTLIVTADCGTSSGAEIEAAARRGIDVLVTDHHHAATWPAAAVAVVNPLRADSAYPDARLTGAGVAWKLAQALLGERRAAADSAGGAAVPAGGLVPAADLADLAIIGTVADVAPVLGENRAIAILGLEALRSGPRPGLAALLDRAGIAAERVDLDDIGFALAPRLNAAGRVGEAARAARLLLADDRDEADRLAEEIEAANRERRDLTRAALAEARQALGLEPPADEGEDGLEAGGSGATGPTDGHPLPALLVRGDWPVGIIGLVAGRLSEETGRPAVVACAVDEEAGLLRASCRGPEGWNLAEALIACGALLVRHGGHAAAAGFDIEARRWPEFEARFLELARSAPRPPERRELRLDLVLPAKAVDYALVRELALLAPQGPGNPVPALGLVGFRVVRARLAAGGHTQLVLARDRDVLDAVAFRRPELAASLREGDRVDIVARVSSRHFGGFESIQLEVLDAAAAGTQPAVRDQLGRP
jgi:single-stranded-DNA-specific exonuclease